jgi:hypothetical protein
MEDHMSQLMFQHFLKKRNRMSGKTIQRDRKISSKLVLIEQVIGLAKSFKILTLASNRTEAKLVSDISFVVVQFKKKCIIPPFKLNYFIIESKLLHMSEYTNIQSKYTCNNYHIYIYLGLYIHVHNNKVSLEYNFI